MKLLVLFVIFSVLSTSIASLEAKDRCKNYIQKVRVSHYEVFGVDYPYWFGVGQLQQESNCRNVLSKDGIGSQGLPQITFKVWKKHLKNNNINDLNTIGNQLRAQAYIMKNCKKQAYSSHLWVAYTVYNGGSWVNKEITKARKVLNKREISWQEAKCFCKRGYVHFNNGQNISACKINYDYPKKVYKYGLRYKVFDTNNSKYIFW